jgi:imidazolonepropionase
MRELGIVTDAAVLCVDGKFAAVGKRKDVRRQAPLDCEERDLAGCVALPGLVDSHTHPVFAEPRLLDFEKRIAGASYQEIAAAGGGIRSSVKGVRNASTEELVERVSGFALDAWTEGTTTIEMKSGYGLDLESELKSLRAIQQVVRKLRLTIVPTLLGAHVVPTEYAGERDAYVDLITREMIPAVAHEHLAEFVDVFCEEGAFTPEETETILKAAVAHGLGTRLHVCQFTPVELARFAPYDLASVDHMECATEESIRCLADTNTVATLLPGATYFLGRHDYPPARKLMDLGVAVAIATDYNPGTSPTASMPLMMSMACTQMKMTPAEAITAATMNGAHALRLAHRKGSITVGKDADLAPFLDCRDYREIPYWFGRHHSKFAVCSGTQIPTA